MKRNYTFFIVAVCFFLAAPLFAQQSEETQFEKCDVDRLYQKALEDPEVVKKRAEIEEYTQKWIEKNGLQAKTDDILTIPVVVHIVSYTGNPASNISDEKIFSQIDEMNRMYRRTNDNAENTRDIFLDVVADCEMEFCLAQRTPEGFPTNGITRTASDVQNWEDDGMKFASSGGTDAWPTSRYLNIWVCNSLRGGGVLGYAYIPGTITPSVDGLAIAYNCFGTIPPSLGQYNNGRTAAHEIGHWLNLYHPWGPGNDETTCTADDGVSDTPRTFEPNFSCSFSSNQCSNETPDLPDMVENYMDYAGDACLNSFTLGQKARMRAVITGNGYRSGITAASNLACVPPEQGANNVILDDVFYPTGFGLCTSFEPTIQITNFGTTPIVFLEIHYSTDGGDTEIYYYTPDVPLASLATTEITLPLVGVSGPGIFHSFDISLVSPNGLPDAFPENNTWETINFSTSGIGDGLSFQESFETGNFSDDDWEILDNDNTGFEFTNTAGVGSNNSIFIDNFNYDATGETDAIITQKLDLVSSNPTMTFYAAYALKNEGSFSDEVQISISTDCGDTFIPIAFVKGAELTSADPTTAAFVPTDDSHWKMHTVNLSNYSNVRSAILKIEQIRGEGNNLYLDNINIQKWAVGIDEAEKTTNMFNLYPNPAHNQVVVSWNAESLKQNNTLTIMDNIGRVVLQQNVSKEQANTVVMTEKLSAGIYFVHLSNGENTATEKLMLVK